MIRRRRSGCRVAPPVIKSKDYFWALAKETLTMKPEKKTNPLAHILK